MQELWVQSQDQEDPREKEMATHSSILAWKIPWIEESGVLQSMGSQRVKHDLETKQWGIYITLCYVSLSSSGTNPPTQVEDEMMIFTSSEFYQLKLGLYLPLPQFYVEFSALTPSRICMYP